MIDARSRCLPRRLGRRRRPVRRAAVRPGPRDRRRGARRRRGLGPPRTVAARSCPRPQHRSHRTDRQDQRGREGHPRRTRLRRDLAGQPGRHGRQRQRAQAEGADRERRQGQWHPRRDAIPGGGVVLYRTQEHHQRGDGVRRGQGSTDQPDGLQGERAVAGRSEDRVLRGPQGQRRHPGERQQCRHRDGSERRPASRRADQIAQLLAPGGLQPGTGGEEQQRLDARVRHQVGRACGRGPDPGGHHHEPQLGRGGRRQEQLEVGLDDGHRAQDDRGRRPDPRGRVIGPPRGGEERGEPDQEVAAESHHRR